MSSPSATADDAGTWRLGDLTVNRLGFGAMRLTGDRSWALSNCEYCPAGGPERSWVTWSGGLTREAVAVFRHGGGRRWAWRGPVLPARASGTGALRG